MDKSLILKQIKLHLGIKKDGDFASFLGITPQMLSNWRSRKSYDVELLYTKCEKINPHWLLTGEGEMLKPLINKDLVKLSQDGIPFIPTEAFAGMGLNQDFAISEFQIEQRYHIPLFCKNEVDFMISVKGSSMTPNYHSGDVVACRFVKEMLFFQWNKVYVINTKSQGTMMKRVKKSPTIDFISCCSDNSEFQDFEVPKTDIITIALVVGVVRAE